MFCEFPADTHFWSASEAAADNHSPSWRLLCRRCRFFSRKSRRITESTSGGRISRYNYNIIIISGNCASMPSFLQATFFSQLLLRILVPLIFLLSSFLMTLAINFVSHLVKTKKKHFCFGVSQSLKNVQSPRVGCGKRLVGLDRVLYLIYTGRTNLSIRGNLELGSERKEKSILMSCTRRYSKNRVEPSGTVGRQNFDLLEVA